MRRRRWRVETGPGLCVADLAAESGAWRGAVHFWENEGGGQGLVDLFLAIRWGEICASFPSVWF